MKIKEAIVLAGGFGTRLQGVVKDLPKPMAPINDVPFLAYQLNYLKTQGVERIVLSVGYLHETIVEYFNYSYNGMEIDYAIEKDALGTGGGIALALSKIKSDFAFVLNGDTMFRVDLLNMENFHFTQQSDLTLALKKMDNIDRFGSVDIENNKITGFLEKNAKKGAGFINGGIYIMEKNFFEKLNLKGKFSFEKDCLEIYYKTLNFKGFCSEAYFLDIGIPEDYEKANIEFRKNQF